MPYYNKTVRDTYEDSAVVEVDDVTSDADTRVYLTVREFAKDQVAALSLEPAQARRLARALKRAANVAEGKPAKTPKARVIDGDGDVWERVGDDLYCCPSETHLGDRSVAGIRSEFGIAGEGK